MPNTKDESRMCKNTIWETIKCVWRIEVWKGGEISHVGGLEDILQRSEFSSTTDSVHNKNTSGN